MCVYIYIYELYKYDMYNMHIVNLSLQKHKPGAAAPKGALPPKPHGIDSFQMYYIIHNVLYVVQHRCYM